MSFDKLRKIVVIKNIPSSYIEEAIFILRENSNVEAGLPKKGSVVSEKIKLENDYLIKEAQSIISNYIKECEQKDGKIQPPNAKESKVSGTKENMHRKFSANSFIYIALISSILVFTYLLIRIIASLY